MVGVSEVLAELGSLLVLTVLGLSSPVSHLTELVSLREGGVRNVVELEVLRDGRRGAPRGVCVEKSGKSESHYCRLDVDVRLSSFNIVGRELNFQFSPMPCLNFSMRGYFSPKNIRVREGEDLLQFVARGCRIK